MKNRIGQHIINQINSFQTFKFDTISKRIVNKRNKEKTNIDEFLAIQHLLDNHRILYQFNKNFEIQIVN